MDFLTDNKKLLKKLLDELTGEYEYVSILAEDNYARSYSVSKRGTFINEVGLLSKRGFTVRVFDDGIYSEYSFDNINEREVPAIKDRIALRLRELRDNVPSDIGINRNIRHIEEEECHFDKSTPCEIDPRSLGDEEIIRVLTEISEAGRNVDKRMVDCTVTCNYQCIDKLFLSAKKDLRQHITWMCGAYSAMARENDITKESYEPFSVLGGGELLNSMKKGAEKTAGKALELLGAKHIKPGTYECICRPDVTGMIVHEAFGHGVEMDMFVKDRAQAKDFVGKRVASDLVTMHDSAVYDENSNKYNNVATFFFDDEGVISKDTVIIDKGILKQGMCDLVSAGILNCEPTGNGRRESFARKAYTRMTNTYFEGGSCKVEDMIASVKYGFLLEDAMSGMEDPKNWGIQCMVNTAREIRDGRLTGNIFSPIVLTGYVPDLLKSVSMVSDNAELSGSGFCGKGYKEWVKVSDGGSYIKADITLG